MPNNRAKVVAVKDAGKVRAAAKVVKVLKADVAEPKVAAAELGKVRRMQ
jgi:hypothetical protein